MAVHLLPFDPTRDFVAQAPFHYLGKPYYRGVPFPKADVQTERQLRQLYEARRITYADTPRGRKLLTTEQTQAPTVPEVVRPRPRKPGEKVAAKPAPKPAEASTEEQRVQRLVKRHNHATLFKKASGLAGVTSDMTKAQIATALVRHDRDVE